MFWLLSIGALCVCSSHGYQGKTCTASSLSCQRLKCYCYEGFYGSECNLCDYNYKYSQTANGFTCTLCIPHSHAGGYTEECICNTGYDGENCDQCAINYKYSSTADGFTCTQCPPHSTATAGQNEECACDEGYDGENCDQCAINYKYSSTADGFTCTQ